MDNIFRLDLAQEILRKSTGFLRRVIAPVGGMEGLTLSYVCPPVQGFPVGRLHLVGYRRDTETAATERRNIATGGVRLVEALHERS